eukprot:sb/3472371/
MLILLGDRSTPELSYPSSGTWADANVTNCGSQVSSEVSTLYEGALTSLNTSTSYSTQVIPHFKQHFLCRNMKSLPLAFWHCIDLDPNARLKIQNGPPGIPAGARQKAYLEHQYSSSFQVEYVTKVKEYLEGSVSKMSGSDLEAVNTVLETITSDGFYEESTTEVSMI